MENLLKGWENFYVITGSSAGGLTGLTFVVIALAADAQRIRLSGLRVFVTPIILHFGVVLALAAFLSMPHPSVLALSLGLGVAAIVGLAYCALIVKNMPATGTADYSPVLEDWIWTAILPITAYTLLLAAAFEIWGHLERALYAVAIATLGLLFIGIHNAWDIAVWMTTMRGGAENTKP
jgi:hypothetical protein